jgi:AraC-like DNA-binding protein
MALQSRAVREIDNREALATPALSGCNVSWVLGGAAEVVEAAAEHRSFPSRVSAGLGVCLKAGPQHRLRADGRNIDYPADAVCIRAPGCVWSVEGTGPVAFLSLDLHASLLPAGLHRFAMTFATAEVLPLHAYVRAFRQRPSAHDELMTDLLCALGRAGLVTADELSITAPARAAARARERLESDPSRTLPLEELAREAGTNRFSLLRAFKQRFGITPHAYLITLRVERARELLARGSELTGVAHQMGFADQAHFSRAFKRVIGMSPGRYARGARAISFNTGIRAGTSVE